MSALTCGCDPEAQWVCAHHTRERGIDAVVALQRVVGITETREAAGTGWDHMTAGQQATTMEVYAAICPQQEES